MYQLSQATHMEYKILQGNIFNVTTEVTPNGNYKYKYKYKL